MVPSFYHWQHTSKASNRNFVFVLLAFISFYGFLLGVHMQVPQPESLSLKVLESL